MCDVIWAALAKASIEPGRFACCVRPSGKDSRPFIAEVKSITRHNEEKQLRLGLGQVLRCSYQLGSLAVPVLVAERPPRDPGWEKLCEHLGVILVWPEVLAERLAAFRLISWSGRDQGCGAESTIAALASVRADPHRLGLTMKFREVCLPPWFLGFWAVFLTVTSLQPHRVPQFGHGRPIHAVLHVLAFGVLGSLAILTSSRRYRSLAIVCCVAHGFLIEVIQARLHPDAIEWGDIRDDALGVVIFSLLTLAVLAIFRQRQNSN